MKKYKKIYKKNADGREATSTFFYIGNFNFDEIKKIFTAKKGVKGTIVLWTIAFWRKYFFPSIKNVIFTFVLLRDKGSNLVLNSPKIYKK